MLSILSVCLWNADTPFMSYYIWWTPFSTNDCNLLHAPLSIMSDALSPYHFHLPPIQIVLICFSVPHYYLASCKWSNLMSSLFLLLASQWRVICFLLYIFTFKVPLQLSTLAIYRAEQERTHSLQPNCKRRCLLLNATMTGRFVLFRD
jgi:hypothetical protein